MSEVGFSNITLNTDIEKKIPWRNLEIKDRLNYLEEFIQKNFNNDKTEKKINNETIEILKEKIQNNGLKTKKELVFDQVNKRIVKINTLIKCNNNFYNYKPDLLNKKYNIQKKAKNLLFKKR